MNYVRCINNQGYEVSLREGALYRVLPPEPGDGRLLRIMDETAREAGSEEGYLFAPERFEPVQADELAAAATSAITVHLSPALAGILHAEALVARKPVSALVRAWLDEHVDLPQ
jgi:hypothetical protein